MIRLNFCFRGETRRIRTAGDERLTGRIHRDAAASDLSTRRELPRIDKSRSVGVDLGDESISQDVGVPANVHGHRIIPFGSYVRREFGDRAFALGFSAYSGSYAMTGQPVRQLSAGPDDSLDGRAIAGP